MYSLVLMMAMTNAPTAPTWHCHKSCYGGCYGCAGGYYYGYSSYACSGCAGNVTSYNSCHGYAPNYYAPFSCFGYGVYGGASYYFPSPIYPNPTSGYGYGYPIPANSIPRIEKLDEPPVKKTDTKPPEPKLIDPKADIKEKLMLNSADPRKAQVVVYLPADAKLFANGQATNLTSSERSFNTPILENGRDYQYEMKIEYARDGRTIIDKQMVKVRAGAVSVVEFAEQTNETVATNFKFVAPEGTRLFVDENPLTLQGNGEYMTPKLTKGAQYNYTVRAELQKDGRNETRTQRVVFNAGEPVIVDFMDLAGITTAAK